MPKGGRRGAKGGARGGFGVAPCRSRGAPQAHRGRHQQVRRAREGLAAGGGRRGHPLRPAVEDTCAARDGIRRRRGFEKGSRGKEFSPRAVLRGKEGGRGSRG